MVVLAQPQQFFNPDYEPFYHGVASGDPLPAQVIIWSRVTTDQPSVEVEWFVAEDTTFTNIIASGNLSTDVSKDYTVKIDVQNLNKSASKFFSSFLDSLFYYPPTQTIFNLLCGLFRRST